MAAGAFASQWDHARSSDVCPVPSEAEGHWSNTVIGVLCLIGLVGILKMLIDMIRAYWELCVHQAASRLDRSSGLAPAADIDHGQVRAQGSSIDHEGEQGSLRETAVPRVP